MSLFVMADTHLSLSADKPMDKFGSRWENYTEKIDSRWRHTIGAGDTVVIPGDISWAMRLPEAEEDFRFLNSLPGKKIILKGNHDYWWDTRVKLDRFCAEHGFDTISFLYNDAVRCGDFILCGSRGWYTDGKKVITHDEVDTQKIVTREVGRIRLSLTAGAQLQHQVFETEGTACELLVFLHFPPVFENYVCPEIVGELENFGVKRCWFGHVHGNYTVPPVTEYHGILFSFIAADFLDFWPQKILKA